MDALTLVLSLIGGVGAAVGLILAVLDIREKLRPVRPHPLEAVLHDIAAAIRARAKA